MIKKKINQDNNNKGRWIKTNISKDHQAGTFPFFPNRIKWSICRLSSAFLLDNLKATEKFRISDKKQASLL